ATHPEPPKDQGHSSSGDAPERRHPIPGQAQPLRDLHHIISRWSLVSEAVRLRTLGRRVDIGDADSETSLSAASGLTGRYITLAGRSRPCLILRGPSRPPTTEVWTERPVRARVKA